MAEDPGAEEPPDATGGDEAGAPPGPLPGAEGVAWARQVLGLVDRKRLGLMHAAQGRALEHLRGANGALGDFVLYSEEKLGSVGPAFQKAARQLKQIRTDLDLIHRRSAAVAERIRQAHPQLELLTDDELEALAAGGGAEGKAAGGEEGPGRAPGEGGGTAA